MAIRFDQESKIFYINTPNTTYAIALTNNDSVLRHIYWGKSIKNK